MGINISRPVVIKAIVTESFKRLYIQDLEEAIKRVNAIEVQLDSQIRRAELERTVTPQARAIRQQLELERARQEATRSRSGTTSSPNSVAPRSSSKTASSWRSERSRSRRRWPPSRRT